MNALAAGSLGKTGIATSGGSETRVGLEKWCSERMMRMLDRRNPFPAKVCVTVVLLSSSLMNSPPSFFARMISRPVDSAGH